MSLRGSDPKEQSSVQQAKKSFQIDPVFHSYAAQMGTTEDLIEFAKEVLLSRSDRGDFPPSAKRCLARYLQERALSQGARAKLGMSKNAYGDLGDLEKEESKKRLQALAASLKVCAESYGKMQGIFENFTVATGVSKVFSLLDNCSLGDRQEFAKGLARKLLQSSDQSLRDLKEACEKINENRINEALEDILEDSVEVYYHSKTGWQVLMKVCSQLGQEKYLQFVSLADIYLRMQQQRGCFLLETDRLKLECISQAIIGAIEEDEETQLAHYPERRQAVRRFFSDIFHPEKGHDCWRLQVDAMKRGIKKIYIHRDAECAIGLSDEMIEKLADDFDGYIQEIRDGVYVEKICVLRPHLQEYVQRLSKQERSTLLQCLQNGD